MRRLLAAALGVEDMAQNPPSLLSRYYQPPTMISVVTVVPCAKKYLGTRSSPPPQATLETSPHMLGMTAPMTVPDPHHQVSTNTMSALMFSVAEKTTDHAYVVAVEEYLGELCMIS